MKMNKLVLATIPGAIAVVALVLSLRSPIDPALIVGYGAVATLLGVAATEYRINRKRVFGRN